jgi:phage tail sheath protein FI
MALLRSESPNVTVKEIDLSGSIPGVTSTTAAFVGDFAWGPTTPVLVGTEEELVSKFGSPRDGGDAKDFLAITQFLKYSGSAFVARAAGEGASAATGGIFTAKHVGTYGNKITVHVCDTAHWADTTTATVTVNTDVQATDADGNLLFEQMLDSDGVSVDDPTKPIYETQAVDASTDGWQFASLFTSAPDSDERHVVVTVDGDVVETYSYVKLSTSFDGVTGESQTITEAMRGSSWVSVTGDPASISTGETPLTNGENGTAVKASVALDAAYGDKDLIQVDFLVAHNVSQADLSDVIAIAERRMDCVVVASPDVAPSSVEDVTSWANVQPSSSYLIMDGNHVQVYNKYSDQYVMIPACSTTAGIMAASDDASAPWFSPAGTRRGQYFGVSALSFNPTMSDRDVMYKARVNPIVSMPGQGTVLFGDKTALSRPSAFDRINVRRMFLVIERAIGEAAKSVLFELNDDFTRAEFTNIVEPFLREIQGRRGITDFRVVCDETNNTPEVVDRNEFIASCFIKPARSVNYVTLNFVAVRSGVEFEEVVGQV